MKKIFLLAMTGIMLAGSVAYAGGHKKDCKKCTKQDCKTECKGQCPKGSCPKG